MFETLSKLLNGKPLHAANILPLDEIANLLKTNPQALEEFERAYQAAEFEQGISDNLFKVNSKQMAELLHNENDEIDIPTDIASRIVDELIALTQVFEYDNKKHSTTLLDYTHALPETAMVTNEEIKALPKESRPNLTGNLMQIDIPDSGYNLASMWSRYLSETNPRNKQHFYNMFRQGLDLLDVDNLTYAMINTNPNSMGNWLPYIIKSVEDEQFFKIPSTKIVKLPVTLLQLTRQDYMQLSPTTMKIVNDYCKAIFDLKSDGDYFVKTGTYSSKFDFRNARIHDPNEVNELGQYLLFIHWQALQMAHFDLSGRNQPVRYGVSTTTEWVVREFIPDVENNTTIYNGLPLRTEYRAFVDFDNDTVLGIHPYWDPEVMKTKFESIMDNDIQAKHDYITYKANEERLMSRYHANKDIVIEHLAKILPDINLNGQWSIDIMQNGNDFYIIDMALAENSMFYDIVPMELRAPITENWLPKIEMKGK